MWWFILAFSSPISISITRIVWYLVFEGAVIWCSWKNCRYVIDTTAKILSRVSTPSRNPFYLFVWCEFWTSVGHTRSSVRGYLHESLSAGNIGVTYIFGIPASSAAPTMLNKEVKQALQTKFLFGTKESRWQADSRKLSRMCTIEICTQLRFVMTHDLKIYCLRSGNARMRKISADCVLGETRLICSFAPACLSFNG